MRADMLTIVQPAGGGAVTVSWRFTTSAEGFDTGVGAGIAAAKPLSRMTALMSRDMVKDGCTKVWKEDVSRWDLALYSPGRLRSYIPTHLDSVGNQKPTGTYRGGAILVQDVQGHGRPWGSSLS